MHREGRGATLAGGRERIQCACAADVTDQGCAGAGDAGADVRDRVVGHTEENCDGSVDGLVTPGEPDGESGELGCFGERAAHPAAPDDDQIPLRHGMRGALT
jgi:hypothetical protein